MTIGINPGGWGGRNSQILGWGFGGRRGVLGVAKYYYWWKDVRMCWLL